jgi:predicted nucleic acid-binding protein
VAKSYQVESLIIDTGVIYALADRKDDWHAAAARFMSDFSGRLFVPSGVVPEACYLLNTYLGRDAEMSFVRALVNREMVLEHWNAQDMTRIAELLKKYRDANIGFVDASVVALAERLKICGILTTDRRHFAAIKPQHCKEFRLLP